MVAEPVDDEQFEEDDADAPETRPTAWERLSTRWQAPPGQTGSTGRTTKWSVDRLDARERRFCFFASAAALIFGVSIYVTETNNKHFHLAKNQFTPFTTLIVGLVAAAFLLVATLVGRRALVGFVALFTFLAFSNSAFVLGFPFVILAAWLLYRSYKIQKAAAADLRAGRTQVSAKSDAPAKEPPARPAPSSSSRATTKGRAKKAKGPPGPEANKRYTPKRPAPPAQPTPKPSWRERRAAKATD